MAERPTKRRRIEGPLLRRALSLGLQPDLAPGVAGFVEAPVFVHTSPSWSYRYFCSAVFENTEVITPTIAVSGCGQYEFPPDTTVSSALRVLRASHRAEGARVVFSTKRSDPCGMPTSLLYDSDAPVSEAFKGNTSLFAHAEVFHRRRVRCSVQ